MLFQERFSCSMSVSPMKNFNCFLSSSHHWPCRLHPHGAPHREVRLRRKAGQHARSLGAPRGSGRVHPRLRILGVQRRQAGQHLESGRRRASDVGHGEHGARDLGGRHSDARLLQSVLLPEAEGRRRCRGRKIQLSNNNERVPGGYDNRVPLCWRKFSFLSP